MVSGNLAELYFFEDTDSSNPQRRSMALTPQHQQSNNQKGDANDFLENECTCKKTTELGLLKGFVSATFPQTFHLSERQKRQRISSHITLQ